MSENSRLVVCTVQIFYIDCNFNFAASSSGNERLISFTVTVPKYF